MSTASIYKDFLDVAIEAVKAAEKIINNHYKGDLGTQYKSDRSPVTIADKDSESAIKEIIKKSFPDHGFLGEESGNDGRASEFTWVVDPIDGTKNYTRGIPLFATQIALMHNDEVVVGLSLASQLNELVTAYKGGGTYLNSERIHVSEVNKIENAYLTFGGLKYFRKHNLDNNLVKLSTRTYYSRGIGDAWSYHLLARGAMDIMIEAETKIWDICAASIIVEEAGGKVTDIKGNKLCMTTTSIIATNSHVHEDVLLLFK